ncbi:MAG: hypothetical protein LBS95_00675 [Mycoplasmataceae bacterium]|nr:hypothetical protein [Mycoplasmataceae bacterium]
MANSDRLSEMQKSIGGGKKLTEFSKYMENNVKDCLKFIIKDLETKMKIKLKWEKSIELKTII